MLSRPAAERLEVASDLLPSFPPQKACFLLGSFGSSLASGLRLITAGLLVRELLVCSREMGHCRDWRRPCQGLVVPLSAHFSGPQVDGAPQADRPRRLTGSCDVGARWASAWSRLHVLPPARALSRLSVPPGLLMARLGPRASWGPWDLTRCPPGPGRPLSPSFSFLPSSSLEGLRRGACGSPPWGTRQGASRAPRRGEGSLWHSSLRA